MLQLMQTGMLQLRKEASSFELKLLADIHLLLNGFTD